MIDSLFIISSTGNFVVEKHYQAPVPRSICEPFLEYVDTIRDTHRSPEKKKKAARGDSPGKSPPRKRSRVNAKTEQKIVGSLHQVPKIIRAENPRMALVHICRDRLVYLAVVSKDVVPLLVIELLSSMHRVLSRYCCSSGGEVTLNEDVLRQNFSTVYLLLDEMIDSSGNPFSLELNSLEAIIDPPSTLKKVTQVVAGGTPQLVKSDTADQSHMPKPYDPNPSVIADTWNTLSATVGAALGNTPTKIGGPSDDVWWRKADAIYGTNEIYIDTIERADMVLDENGLILSGGIIGELNVTSRLSGAQPEVAVTLKDPKLLENASFHNCVKLHKFERDSVLSFIPPDGQFILANYWLNDNTVKLPFHFRGSVVYHSDRGLVNIECSPRLSVTRNHKVLVDAFRVEIRLPEQISHVNFDQGLGRFDERSKLIVFDVGRLDGGKFQMKAVLRYSTNPKTGEADVPWEEKSVARIDYTVSGWPISGMRLDSLDVLGINYTPYKACRYSSHGGRLEMRMFSS